MCSKVSVCSSFVPILIKKTIIFQELAVLQFTYVFKFR